MMEYTSMVLCALDNAGVEHDVERLPNGKTLVVAETNAGGLLARLVAPRNEMEAREVASRLVRDVCAA